MEATTSLEHHKREEYCTTRLKYRQGRELKAVYTVVNESKYLLVFGVPRINLKREVQKLFHKFGSMESCTLVTETLSGKIDIEQFTDVYQIKYNSISNARRAKRFLDAKNFYGGTLHISYAPEYETLTDLRDKFNNRASEVQRQCRRLQNSVVKEN